MAFNVTTNNAGAVDANSVWIYHERQEALLCGQHALNNLAQANVFSASMLAEIAQHLDTLELNVYAQNNEGGRNSKEYRERLAQGSHHVDEAGNFSIEVLKAAVQREYGIPLPHLSSQQRREAGEDICNLQGFLCHKSDHWFAIRNIGGRFWNLNSLLERPVVITHFTLGSEMDKWVSQGYTVFYVESGLPVGGVKGRTGSTSNNHAQWHKMSDLLRGKSTGADPWEKLNGAGMRLDGKRPGSHNESAAMIVDGLTEDEMLQIAMQESLQQPTVSVTRTVGVLVPEPPAGSVGAIRIQFRMPNGQRVVRRFLETDRVTHLYMFVQQYESCADRDVELLFDFPPKSLSGFRESTIREANLANETIQGRFL
jgi:Ataxin-3